MLSALNRKPSTEIETQSFSDAMIKHVLSHYNLGELHCQPIKMSGGLTNGVFHLNTTNGQYVMKVIDGASSRARALDDYISIERLMAYFATQTIPLILAKKVNFNPVYHYEGKYILLYPFVKSQQLGGPIGPVNSSDAYKAGELLGQIHQCQNTLESAACRKFQRILEYSYSVDLDELKKLLVNHHDMHGFINIAEKTQASYQRLRSNMVYGHGDYQPHNILIHEAKLVIIDWELAGLINPDMEFMIGAITFSGYATNEFNEEAFQQFFLGYAHSGCRLQHDLEDIILAALHKCWVNWIAFNLKNANKEVAKVAFHGLQSMIEKISEIKLRVTQLQLQVAAAPSVHLPSNALC